MPSRSSIGKGGNAMVNPVGEGGGLGCCCVETAAECREGGTYVPE